MSAEVLPLPQSLAPKVREAMKHHNSMGVQVRRRRRHILPDGCEVPVSRCTAAVPVVP